MRKKTPKKKSAAPAKKAPAREAPPASKKGSAKKDTRTFDEKMRQAMSDVDGVMKGTASSLLLSDAPDSDVEGIESLLWSKPRFFTSTRSIAIDKALGIPGIPSGRLTEIYGPFSSGKSTLLDQLIAETQSMGGVAVLCDTEHARDLSYMKALGVRSDRLIISQVQTIESVFSALVQYGDKLRAELGPDVPILFAWDSVAETPTIAEMAAKPGDKFRAEAAKAIRQGLRATTQIISRNQITVVFVNQVYKAMGYGSDGAETYGGDGIKFAASIRLDLFIVGQLKPQGAGEDDLVPPVGNIVNLRVVKNKMAAPWRKRRFAIGYGAGIDNGWSLWHDFAGAKQPYPSADPAIVQSGTWFKIADSIQEKLGVEIKAWQGGHWPLAALCAEHPGLWGELLARYKELPQ